ncbi:iron ABC transporter permease [Flammeovirgaceae bacterium SG7u.111]|nr:iron ABC transporter permease [Flammeovirgaceae bacterium SG7u.132]WPO37062.1 iron ABC transporter permease [Flammeovirgaceae bacterium SG7u.111]
MQRTSSIDTRQEIKLPSLAPKLSWMLALITLLILFLVLDVALGSVNIPFTEVVAILVGKGSDNIAWLKIVETIRVPKAFTAILAGAALAVSGLQMQTLFRNPLAGPSVLGISAGASLGVAVVMLSSGFVTTSFALRQLGIGGSWLIILASTLGSAFILLIIIGISLRINDNVVLLIVGLMIANLTIAMVSIWQYFSSPEQIQDYLLWTFGSLGGVTQQHLKVLSISVGVGVLITFISSKYLNLLLMGENYASSMGLNLKKIKILIILSTSLLAGAVTGFCGPIGFVGIAVPHLCRSLFNTSDHRVLIPSACLMGACIMLFCDIIAQIPGHQSTLPINSVTAIIGSPVVIWVIIQRKNLKGAF